MATNVTNHAPRNGADEQALAAIVAHEPHNPVRDDRLLGPTEDLDREPDGVPHNVVGMTAGFAVIFAALVAFMMLLGSTTTRIAVLALVAIAVPVVIHSLRKKADRERAEAPPAR